MVFSTTDYPLGIQSYMEGGPGGNNCRDGVWSSHSTTSPTDSPDTSTFIGKLKEVMQSLLPPKTQHNGQHPVFVSQDLSSCSHVFLRTDALRKGLQSPYEGPFQVLDRNEKIFKINKNGKELTVNIDRVKPAYVLRDCDSTRLPTSESPTPQENLQEDRTSEAPARTTRPPR
ncbi:hypothetical protein AVEN_50944-1 [Araneus ventricosus]|uniref:Uncharacterized protein n=1 Tax=Araneus ventricosus TaxID=182803 RepID=A0A4Y2SW97_ARAVE|nr:hypothetical protein AVEN_50944-1 [Araneus ventricosus]